MPSDPLGGILPPGSRKRDALHLAGGEILDLAGSVSEWTSDVWSGEDGPCWSGPKTIGDPVCADGMDDVFRGGSWTSDVGHLAAANRAANPRGSNGIDLGFRCVRSGL
jgi:formylglycine-generating enzyme required for sulfatase activity